ncbi:FUSC family protein [Paraburkholderia youngii]|uniref:FUSC family protein n=1 Tax=Paraburkholderia youngii TaxID=2782701 RepID=UPI003D221BB3
MARRAVDMDSAAAAGYVERPLRPGVADLLKLLAPFPGRAATAARVALICALTVWVTSAYGTPEAALSAYIVFFMIRPDRTTSFVTGVALLVLVSIVIGLVLAVAIVVVDYPPLRVAAMALLSASLLFVTSASKLRPVGAIVAMIVGFALDQLGRVPVGELATRALLYAWLFVAIPAGMSVAVSLVCAPSPRRLASRELAERLRLAARGLREPGPTRDALDAALRKGNAEIGSWLKMSALEGTSLRADVVALQRAAVSSVMLLAAVDLACGEASARLPASFVEPIATTLEEMARMLDAGGYPVDIELTLPSSAPLTPLARAVADTLHDTITRFAEPTVESGAAHDAPSQPAPPAPHAGFFAADAFTNLDHVRYALKTTVAAMFCYLLYSQLDWPGIHTCFITVYVVSLGSTAETVEKLALRIAGCIAGALAGTAAIVFLMPALTSIGELMAVVAIGAGLSAWVAFGSPRIAYAGFQIAFAFFLCVIQGAEPAFDLTIARDRTIGILIGNLVVYLVFTRVWPVSIAARVEQALAALREQWARLAAPGYAGKRRADVAAALARGRALREDVALMHYEPSWVRPGPQWLTAHHRELAGLAALEAPMLLLVERQPAAATIEGWLQRLAAVAHGQLPRVDATTTTQRPAPDVTDPPSAALQSLGDARLDEFERAASADAAKE